ncbi:protein of unknown function [Arachidicoccus rhizosphaerae]|uniref:Ferric-dicitrate binding protein FerR, regulates iron transport through sigma-19 n=1 Tax=Arachidicoccus rhizosphaerae TaxID=551991 RepID=A0A1H3XVE8_9BACT|nr:FecR family protein [Arachidicoccus rhizosphaerae]SEA02488.1 protein of unknown function [Arachidicoccus rhizosphaerae]
MHKLLKQVENFWSKKTEASDDHSLLDAIEEAESSGELENYLRREFERELLKMTLAPINKKEKNGIWRNVLNGQTVKKTKYPEDDKNRLHIYSLVGALAACLILAVGGFIFYQYSGIKGSTRHLVAVNNDSRPLSHRVILSNTTDKDEKRQLSDHSMVILSPGSQISFLDSFAKNSRMITLEGKAIFKVARDIRRPFIVTAGGVKTTALGTTFSVDSRKKRIVIRLFEGKIAIAPTAISSLKMATVYLNPGDEFRADLINSLYWKGKAASSEIKKVIPKEKSSDLNHDEDLIFNKSDLRNVFLTLGKHYHTKIEYDKALVNGLSFTGSFKRSDSLTVILRIVCSLNGLDFENKEGGFVIQK